MLSQLGLSKPVQSRECRRDSGAVLYTERQTQKTVRFHSDARPSLSTDDRTSDTAGRSAACARCFDPIVDRRSVGRSGGWGGRRLVSGQDSSYGVSFLDIFFFVSKRYFQVHGRLSSETLNPSLSSTLATTSVTPSHARYRLGGDDARDDDDDDDQGLAPIRVDRESARRTSRDDGSRGWNGASLGNQSSSTSTGVARALRSSRRSRERMRAHR